MSFEGIHITEDSDARDIVAAGHDKSGNDVIVTLHPNGKASACFGHHELEDISIDEAFRRVDAYMAEKA